MSLSEILSGLKRDHSAFNKIDTKYMHILKFVNFLQSEVKFLLLAGG